MASSYRIQRVVVLLLVVGALGAAQLFLMEPESTPVWQAVFNSGHALLYGVVSLVVLALLDTLWPTWKRGRRYLEAFGIALLAGAGMEALQWFGPREPQWVDLLRNALGSAAFLAVAASVDPSMLPDPWRRRVWTKAGLRVGAMGALGIAFVPVILAGGTIVARNRAFPRICGFDTMWERQLVLVNESADIEYRSAGDAAWLDPDGSAAYVTFRPGRYSVLTLSDPYQDWTGYDALSFRVYSELARTVTVTLWIADDHHVAGNWGSFRRRLRIKPGENRLDISLMDVRETDRDRQLDMIRINKVAIYASRVQDPFSLLLDDFRLE